jgi:uncharacterized protein (TIGR01244 family)
MLRIVEITPAFAVTGALKADDLAEVASGGFRSLISNLPDGELPGFPASDREGALAGRCGLAFRHIPLRKAEMFSARNVLAMREALGALPPPILAHCASGERSALAWATAALAAQDVERVLAQLRAAGFDFAPLRVELESLAGLGDGVQGDGG